MKERLDYIDSMKGLLIILVVIGHILGYYAPQTFIVKMIYAFHMPAFFMISGFLLNRSSSFKGDFSHFLNSRIHSLVIPYLFWEFFAYIIISITYGVPASPIQAIYRTIRFGSFLNVGWFLMALFYAEITYYIVVHCSSEKASFLIAMSIFILAFVLPYQRVSATMVGFAFLVFGYHIHHIKESIPLILLALITFIGATYLNVRIDIHNAVYGNPLLFIAETISGTYISYCISKRINLERVGRHSLTIMGIHMPLIIIVRFFSGLNY